MLKKYKAVSTAEGNQKIFHIQESYDNSSRVLCDSMEGPKKKVTDGLSKSYDLHNVIEALDMCKEIISENSDKDICGQCLSKFGQDPNSYRLKNPDPDYIFNNIR